MVKRITAVKGTMESRGDLQKHFDKVLGYKRSHAKLKSPILAKYNGKSGGLPPLKTPVSGKKHVSQTKSTEVLTKSYI